jgi:hypothetical protein
MVASGPSILGRQRAMVNISVTGAEAVTMGTDSPHPGHIRPT